MSEREEVGRIIRRLQRAFPQLVWEEDPTLDSSYPPGSSVVDLRSGEEQVLLEVTGRIRSVRAHFRKFVFESIALDELHDFLDAVLAGRYEQRPPWPHRLLPWSRRIRITGRTRTWDEVR